MHSVEKQVSCRPRGDWGNYEDARAAVFYRQMETAVVRTEKCTLNTLRDKLPLGIYQMQAEGKTAKRWPRDC